MIVASYLPSIMPSELMIRVPLRDEIPNLNYIKNQKRTYRAPEPKTPAPETKQHYSAILHLESMELQPDLHPGVTNQK